MDVPRTARGQEQGGWSHDRDHHENSVDQARTTPLSENRTRQVAPERFRGGGRYVGIPQCQTNIGVPRGLSPQAAAGPPGRQIVHCPRVGYLSSTTSHAESTGSYRCFRPVEWRRRTSRQKGRCPLEQEQRGGGLDPELQDTLGIEGLSSDLLGIMSLPEARVRELAPTFLKVLEEFNALVKEVRGH